MVTDTKGLSQSSRIAQRLSSMLLLHTEVNGQHKSGNGKDNHGKRFKVTREKSADITLKYMESVLMLLVN